MSNAEVVMLFCLVLDSVDYSKPEYQYNVSVTGEAGKLEKLQEYIEEEN